MERPSTAAIERRLVALDHEGFVAFVAALWTESGWDVDRDGAVMTATRQGESTRLLVLPPRRLVPGLRRAPSVEEPIDAVVSPLAGTDRASLPRGTPDAPVVDAEAVADRLWYAIDGDARERLLANHLGVDAGGAASGSATSGVPRAIPPARLPRGAGASAAAAGAVLVLLGIAVVLVATGIPIGDSTSGTANASEHRTAGGYATASAAPYDAYPSCERGPGEIAAIATNVTRGSSLSRGLVVVRDFWNPRYIRPRPHNVWRDRIRRADRMAFYEAESVTLHDAEIQGEAAIVPATATIDGEQRRYVFELGRGDRRFGEGCWMLEYFGPSRG